MAAAVSAGAGAGARRRSSASSDAVSGGQPASPPLGPRPRPQRERQALAADAEQRWAELPPEHLGRLGDFLGQPLDLVRAEQVCAPWCGSLREPYEQERLWRRLCESWYQTMAARIIAEGDAEFECTAKCWVTPLPPTAQPIARSPSAGAGAAGAGAAGAKRPQAESTSTSAQSSPLCAAASSSSPAPSPSSSPWLLPQGRADIPPEPEEAEESESESDEEDGDEDDDDDDDDDDDEAGERDDDEEEDGDVGEDRPAAAGVSFDELPMSRWRDLFQRRYLRQQEWDRRRQKRPGTGTGKAAQGEPAEEAPKPKSDGGKAKFHPSGRAKVTRGRENGREKFHAPRLRNCKRCGVEFEPGAQRGAAPAPAPCSWHAGRYVPIGDDGVISTAASAAGKAFDRRAQKLIKAHNRTKGSKKANMIVFDRPCETGVPREDGVIWRWSCCQSESLVAMGCCSGPHS